MRRLTLLVAAVGLFYPTAGDCMNEPVTEFKVVRSAVLFG